MASKSFFLRPVRRQKTEPIVESAMNWSARLMFLLRLASAIDRAKASVARGSPLIKASVKSRAGDLPPLGLGMPNDGTLMVPPAPVGAPWMLLGVGGVSAPQP